MFDSGGAILGPWAASPLPTSKGILGSVVNTVAHGVQGVLGLSPRQIAHWCRLYK